MITTEFGSTASAIRYRTWRRCPIFASIRLGRRRISPTSRSSVGASRCLAGIQVCLIRCQSHSMRFNSGQYGGRKYRVTPWWRSTSISGSIAHALRTEALSKMIVRGLVTCSFRSATNPANRGALKALLNLALKTFPLHSSAATTLRRLPRVASMQCCWPIGVHALRLGWICANPASSRYATSISPAWARALRSVISCFACSNATSSRFF